MFRLYSVLLTLFTPVALLYLFFRSLKSADYRRRWNERFGFIERPQNTGGILFHAASMGEVNAAQALIRAVMQEYPDQQVYVTTFTPTGSDRVRELFRDEVFHCYIPIDLPGAVRRFYDRLSPSCVVVMETEIWPNLYRQARSRNIPLMLANARISQRSISRYRRFPGLTRAALDCAQLIAAQGKADADRLVEIGADPERVVVTGNLKFDVRLPPSLAEQAEALRLAWGADRPVLVAGSAREGEDEMLVEAFKHLLVNHPRALLILVPRHPERFEACAQLARRAGMGVAMRSKGIAAGPDIHCLVVDTMGELLRFYAACDVAFVGGTLVPIGGHNPLEPAALGKPVLTGPYVANVQEIMDSLEAAGAALKVNGVSSLEGETRRLFAEPEVRDQMGRAAFDLVKTGQGALQRTLDHLRDLITAKAG